MCKKERRKEKKKQFFTSDTNVRRSKAYFFVTKYVTNTSTGLLVFLREEH